MTTKMTASTNSDLINFIQASPTPYHAVQSVISRLEQHGFTAIAEHSSWSKLKPGKYWTVRGDSALVAFVLPSDKPIEAFRLIGAHTDSPNLRIKPNGTYAKEGYQQLGVEVYGGVLLNSWLDRDLSIAGRVVATNKGAHQIHLVHFKQPLARVPQLAIHLDREVNERGLVLNRQEHLPAVWGLDDLNSAFSLKQLCATELSIKAESIVSMELMLHDTLPPTIGGLNQEFIFSPRLDNQSMCHASLTALCLTVPHDGVVPMIAMFDHEEIGSASAYGAGTPLLGTVMERLVLSQNSDRERYYQVLAHSICVSADTAHAVHPNYPEKHERNHKPQLNKGPVIKVNSQQRYATCARTAALFEELCQQANVPYQYYVHRTDLPCGSTIGPITATLLGIPTVDVGSPILSMHSIREMAGSKDADFMVKALTAFLCHPTKL